MPGNIYNDINNNNVNRSNGLEQGDDDDNDNDVNHTTSANGAITNDNNDHASYDEINPLLSFNNNNNNNTNSNHSNGSSYHRNNNNQFIVTTEQTVITPQTRNKKGTSRNNNNNNNNNKTNHKRYVENMASFSQVHVVVRTGNKNSTSNKNNNNSFSLFNNNNNNNNNNNSITNTPSIIFRKVCILILLSMITQLIIILSYYDMNDKTINNTSSNGINNNNEHLLPRPLYESPHSSSLGGIMNPSHYDQNKMFHNNNKNNNNNQNNNNNIDEDNEDYFDDMSKRAVDQFTEWFWNADDADDENTIHFVHDNNNVTYESSSIGIHVRSNTIINELNENGHYWHDPFRSPYSSKLYYKNNYNNSSTNNTNGNNSNDLTQDNNNNESQNDDNITIDQETKNNKEVDNDNDMDDTLYITKLLNTASMYGIWNQPEWCIGCIQIDFNKYNTMNRDLPSIHFPKNSWHQHRSYVSEFLIQTKELIYRVKEGIYKEYGLTLLVNNNNTESNNNDNDVKLLNELRDQMFGIKIIDYNNTEHIRIDKVTGSAINVTTKRKISGSAYINQAGYEGLVRKLLHGIITQDNLYVIGVGGNHLYYGNNMFQTHIMQFQYLMEPIFDKLGMKLISRNMGMDVSSTTINSLGGSDIYGESDILWYIPDNYKRSRGNNIELNDGTYDLLHIQSILSGQRIPIILTPNPGQLMKQHTNISQSIWMGNIQPGIDVCKLSSSSSSSKHQQNQKIQLDNENIRACQYIECNTSPGHIKNKRRIHKDICKDQYQSICWIDRNDWNPINKHPQSMNVGHQNEGYPNPNQHLLSSRKLSMLILNALDDAIHRWLTVHEHIILQEETEKEKKQETIVTNTDVIASSTVTSTPATGNTASSSTTTTDPLLLLSSSTSSSSMNIPFLPDDMWHVNPIYNTIRQKTRSVESTSCDIYLQNITSKICHLQMHAYTEWSPRVVPNGKRIKMLIQDKIADYSMHLYELYDGVDLLSPAWELNNNNEEVDDIDVHMIAIATNITEMQKHINNHPAPKLVDVNVKPNFDFVNDDGWIHKDDDANHEIEWKYNEYDNDDDDTIMNPNHRQLSSVKDGSQKRYLLNKKTKLLQKRRMLSNKQRVSRKFQSNAIAKVAWTVLEAPIGYCDGSSQSRCNRIIGNTCLLSNYNHYKASIMGHGDSGPLNLIIPNVIEGILLLRFDWLSGNGYETMNNLPDDFQFLYTIDNGKVIKRNKTEFINMATKLAEDVIIHPLMIEKKNITHNKHTTAKMTTTTTNDNINSNDIQLTIEIRTKQYGIDASILLTHIYYA